jgi:hypothetical protein
MKNMIVLIMISIACCSAGPIVQKRDTCNVPVKAKHENGTKKINKKRPLYQLIFMI